MFADAVEQKMVGAKEEASVDSTGLEAGHRSAHYAHRTGQKRYKLRRWPKLTLACHNASHLLIHALVNDGPSQDAPMLAPIHHVMQLLGEDRYLTRNGCNKPYQRAASGRFYSIIRQCLLIYDRRDPFRLIQDMSFYDRSRDNDLVDEFRLYDSGTPRERFWEGHSMIESYIANNREAIVSWLLP